MGVRILLLGVVLAVHALVPHILGLAVVPKDQVHGAEVPVWIFFRLEGLGSRG